MENPLTTIKPANTENIFFVFLAITAMLLSMLFLDSPAEQWMRRLKVEGNIFMDLYETLRPAVKFLTHGLPIIAFSLFVFIYGKYRSPGLAAVGRSMIAGYLLSGLGVQVLKHLAGRARPRVGNAVLFIGPNLKGDYDSFPSGHTAVSFCLAYILSCYFPRYKVLFYAFGILTAFDRYQGLSHFPSDLIGGMLCGLVAGKLVEKYMINKESVLKPESAGKD